MQTMRCDTKKASAASENTGPVGTSATPRSQHSLHLLLPMCILCRIHSLNGSHIPPAISLHTTDIWQIIKKGK